ncbi:MAG: glycosyltransferase family 2 protein [Amphiplicatus sp.]
MTPALSLVIPCYNEAANLPALVARVREAIARADVEVVLVDNGSTDDSPEVLARLLAARPKEQGQGAAPEAPCALIRSVRVPVNQGYGYGILEGLKAARGRVLGWTHADMQTDPADCLAALALFEAEDAAEGLFVKGRRYGRPFSDVAFTVGMAAFETVLLGRPLWDINAQPTLFPRAFFETWKTPPHDFSLDLYAYYSAKRAGLAVRRFPVRFGARLHGHSHWNVNWAAKRKFIRRTLDYSFRLRRDLV